MLCTTLDQVCQFFIKKRQNSLVYLSLSLESKFEGQRASKIQIRPDVCNKFFNVKKNDSIIYGNLYDKHDLHNEIILQRICF